MKRLDELGVSRAPWEAENADASGPWVTDGDGDDVCWCVIIPHTANARLIAAAPDLYEALRDSWKELIYASVHPKLKTENEIFRWDDIIEKARKALEKAGGAE